MRLETTVMRNRQVYVRYLPTDTPIGDPSPDYLSIRNYPTPDAARSLRAYANRHQLNSRSIGGNVIVPLSDSSVYLAPRDSDIQVEIYSPDPGAARTLVVAGAVRPVTEVNADLTGAVSP